LGVKEQAMSKVATYLQEHLQGEVSTNPAILDAFSTDASVLEMTPEMVVYPRVTSDIRKVARFAWQLAEKGHVLPITARGFGLDQTGGAIGGGIIVRLSAHMNRIFELDAKQKLIRLQPGIGAKGLNDALGLQGLSIPALTCSHATVGGMVASDGSSPLSGKYGTTGSWVSQLEVVLANGDILQTERISKRELNKRKGLQTFEGEIYRAVDGLIEDNRQLIEEKIQSDIRDNVGYSSIAQVKQKDGSFDLTPLFIGSQGTLGIISEMIMKAEFASAHQAAATLTFASAETARDAADQLVALEPAYLEYFDSALFEAAGVQGKTYEFYKNADFIPEAVLLIGFDDFSDRSNAKNIKRLEKLFDNSDGVQLVSAQGAEVDELLAVRSVTSFAAMPATKGASAPPLFDGIYIPAERFEEFSRAVKELASKHGTTLPIHYRVLERLVYTRPTLQLHKVGDKQKIFKMLDEYATLVDQLGGHLIGDSGEGRVKANFAYKQLDPDVLDLFASVKAIFDPYGIFNPGVKQTAELRQLVTHLRKDYNETARPGPLPQF
jgi:FAD/FMN-containing dehydrogenase